jgi:hypothetical protein
MSGEDFSSRVNRIARERERDEADRRHAKVRSVEGLEAMRRRVNMLFSKNLELKRLGYPEILDGEIPNTDAIQDCAYKFSPESKTVPRLQISVGRRLLEVSHNPFTSRWFCGHLDLGNFDSAYDYICEALALWAATPSREYPKKQKPVDTLADIRRERAFAENVWMVMQLIFLALVAWFLWSLWKTGGML